MSKSCRTKELLGCSVPELRLYIEAQFKLGMTWDNWGRGLGKWNIDHKLPCCSFNLLDPQQQKICFNYKNLQPLWWEENRAKEKEDLKIRYIA